MRTLLKKFFKKNVPEVIISLSLLIFFSSCQTDIGDYCLADDPVPMAPAGINWSYPVKGNEQVELFDEVGITWLRIDFYWDRMEPEQGNWNFDDLDYFCELAEEKGFKLIGVLGFDAKWIYEEGQEDQIYIGSEDFTYFLDYISVIIKRYGKYIEEWEIWNEPNVLFNTFWTGPLDDFVDLTSAAVERIREIDPSCKIIAGSMWRYDRSYLKKLHRSGVLEKVDSLSLHPYYDDPIKVIKKTDQLRADLDSMGYESLDIRITETGFNTYGYMPTSCPEDEQAKNVMETLAGLGTRSGPYLIWYTLYNSDAPGQGLWTDHYGVIVRKFDGSFRYKTGGWALRRYNELIAGKYRSDYDIYIDRELENRLACLLFSKDGDMNAQTMILMTDEKNLPVHMEGFDSLNIYNCADGEVIPFGNGFTFELTRDKPLILDISGIENFRLTKE